MSTNSIKTPLFSDRLFELIAYVVIGLGIFIRLKVYIQNRSLFIDEASLARNLCEKQYADFFAVLSYEQYAPPLFMVESKLITVLLGNYEWAMRLTPFVAGIGSLILLYVLLKQFVSIPLVRMYGLSLFCFSFLAIRYGTEFKQYSTDTFLALAYVGLALKDTKSKWNNGKSLKWMLLGGVGLWYSMSLVFILSGIGFFFLSKQRRENWLSIILVIVGWLVSFALYYYFILRYDIGTDYLESYFDSSFLNLSFSIEAWNNNFHIVSELFRNVTDKTAISIGFGLLTFIVGVCRLLKLDKSRAILLLLPVLAVFLASALHYYALVGRLVLFILPLIILTMCTGIESLWKLGGKWVAILLGIFMVLGIANKKGLDYLVQPMTFEEVKPCLSLLAEQSSADDLIYVDYEAVPAFQFYTKHYSDKYQIQGTTIIGRWDSDPFELAPSDTGTTLWIIYSHAVELRIKEAENKGLSFGAQVRCSSSRVRLFEI